MDRRNKYNRSKLPMADVHSKETRSYNMSKIHSKDTKPEILVRKYLFSRGLRFRKNDKRYPGKPDVVLPKYRTVIFVNSCFWHKHIGCRYFVLPTSNVYFWDNKLEANRLRDERNIKLLFCDGWKVIVVWECEIKKLVRDERLAMLYDEITHI
jgi:DNA mismatch endonuclease (patch repair protein)